MPSFRERRFAPQPSRRLPGVYPPFGGLKAEERNSVIPPFRAFITISLYHHSL
jgi:hypothetical protein